MEKELHSEIQRLQGIEENLHGYLAQKQQVQAQLLELESAAEALPEAKHSYQIIGSLMVERSSEEIKNDLDERIERARLRIEAIEKQEKKLKKQAELVQKGIMAQMKKGGDS